MFEYINNVTKNGLAINIDGSKNEEEETGAGVAIPELGMNCSYKITTKASIYTAELTAKLKALKSAVACPPTKVTIQSDSLAVVKSMERHSICSRPDIKEEIVKLMTQLKEESILCNDSMDPSTQRNKRK